MEREPKAQSKKRLVELNESDKKRVCMLDAHYLLLFHFFPFIITDNGGAHSAW